MTEFYNRMTAQRAALSCVNSVSWPREELHGLSSKSISRWVMANNIDEGNSIVLLVRQASALLFFLANKSQEQISDEYIEKAVEVASIVDALRHEVLHRR